MDCKYCKTDPDRYLKLIIQLNVLVLVVALTILIREALQSWKIIEILRNLESVIG